MKFRDYDQDKEWGVVYDACSNDKIGRFFGAIFFPLTVLSNFVPNIVINSNKISPPEKVQAPPPYEYTTKQGKQQDKIDF